MTLNSADCCCIERRRESCFLAIFSTSRRQLRAADALAQLLDLVVVAALAELLPDGLHLLAEDVLALRLAHLLLDHGGDLVLHAEHLELAPDHGEHEAHALLHVEGLEDLLLVADADACSCGKFEAMRSASAPGSRTLSRMPAVSAGGSA